MRAVGYYRPLPIDHPEALVDIEVPRPVPRGRDLLVEVAAVSVNPVDVKVRARAAPEPGQAKILGWDATGTVVEVGPDCTLFKPGDRVWYAGAFGRPGTNSEFHLVDERIAGRMPKSLSFAAAAALPLTAITAWELLFDRFRMTKGGETGAILFIGGAGGVGSIAIQLARRLTQLTVVATASRAETRGWCLGLGAHHVIDHRQPLAPQLAAIGLAGGVDYLASLTQTTQHLPQMPAIIAPQGRFGLIDAPDVLDVVSFKGKSVSIHWEAMFTRSTFETSDMIAQHHILDEVAALVDDGTVRTTATEELGPINAATLRRAHVQVESGRMRGKVVVAGF